MPPKVRTSPIILFPNVEARGALFPARPVTAPRRALVPHISPRLAAHTAVFHRAAVENFMLFPHDERAVSRLAEALYKVNNRLKDHGRYADRDVHQQVHRRNITRFSPPQIDKFLLQNAVPTRNLGVKILFDPIRRLYKVLLQPWEDIGASAGAAIREGGLALFGLNEIRPAIDVLQDKGDVNFVLNGGLAMVIFDGADVLEPAMVPVARNARQFFRAQLGQAKPSGSSIAVEVAPGLNVRYTGRELIGAIEKAAAEAVAAGKDPVFVSDIDGTGLDARGFAGDIFTEWMAGYDGPCADMIRSLVVANGHIKGWDAPAILNDHLKRDFAGSVSEDAVSVAMQAAREYFDIHFFSPDRRAVQMQAIRAMLRIYKTVHAMKFTAPDGSIKSVTTLFVTLRSEVDDLANDGRYASEVALQREGAWNDHTLALRYQGKRLVWSSMVDPSMKEPEPEKTAIVDAYLREHPNAVVVVTADNDTRHSDKYHDHYTGKVIHIHVQGDTPPGAPELPGPGILTVNPSQLELELPGIDE